MAYKKDTVEKLPGIILSLELQNKFVASHQMFLLKNIYIHKPESGSLGIQMFVYINKDGFPFIIGATGYFTLFERTPNQYDFIIFFHFTNRN